MHEYMVDGQRMVEDGPADGIVDRPLRTDIARCLLPAQSQKLQSGVADEDDSKAQQVETRCSDFLAPPPSFRRLPIKTRCSPLLLAPDKLALACRSPVVATRARTSLNSQRPCFPLADS